MRTWQAKFIGILLFLNLLAPVAIAQVIEKDVFGRAQAIVNFTKKVGVENEGERKPLFNERPGSFGFSNDPQESPRFSLSDPVARVGEVRPKRLPRCAQNRRRSERRRKIPTAFRQADYIFFSSEDQTQIRLGKRFAQKAIPFSQNSEAGHPGLDLRLELTRSIKLRCLPTRVVVGQGRRGAEVHYLEGTRAWSNEVVNRRK